MLMQKALQMRIHYTDMVIVLGTATSPTFPVTDHNNVSARAANQRVLCCVWQISRGLTRVRRRWSPR
jgi:hypothetical protein